MVVHEGKSLSSKTVIKQRKVHPLHLILENRKYLEVVEYAAFLQQNHPEYRSGSKVCEIHAIT